MRIKADITPAEREKVKSFAEYQGYTMPRAYGELLSAAIERDIRVIIA